MLGSRGIKILPPNPDLQISPESDGEMKCTARVLQAFALYETKQDCKDKGWFLMRAAIEIDPELKPVKKWKMFEGFSSSTNNNFVRTRVAI